MTSVVIQFRVAGGRLKGPVDSLNKAIAQHEGKQIELVVRKKRSKRSTDQNSYYWACMEIVAQTLIEYGKLTNKDECHEMFKAEFLKYTQIINGAEMKFIGSTANLTKSEFSDYMGRINEWCMDAFGFMLPEPDAQVSIEYQR